MDAEPNLGLPPYLRDPVSRSRRRPSQRRSPSRKPPTRRGGAGRPRKRVWLSLLALLFVSPAIYSWIQMARLPSSLPIGVRSVEWLRQHHFNWLVDETEHYYYSWFNQPQKGGPGLTSLPPVGITTTPATHVKSDYVPPNIKPVFANPLPGEGVWRPSGPPVNGGPPVLVTTFRTETAYPQIVAYLAWFDHTRTASAYYPGRYEPPAATLRGPSMVPYSQRWRLLSTFNGGFIYADGLNGDSLNGVTNEPFKNGNATVVAYKNGKVDIVDWKYGPTAPANIAWARQSLPLIVNHGQLNPKLNLSTDWGYTLGNAVRVWRTGLGIDRHGNLIYVAADYQTVITLAQILKRAGAVRAMELDINPEWYTLITYRHQHGHLTPTQVAYNYQQASTRYLVPDDRDFFAIYRRVPGQITVPLK